MASIYSDELKRRVRNMMISGESDTQISEKTSITTDTLRKWRIKFGLAPSSGGNNNYSQEVKNRCYELMNENKTNAEISEIMGISSTTIAKWRKAADIPNSTASNNSTKYSKEIYEEAIKLMLEEKSYKEIEQVLGVNRSTLSDWRRRAGLELIKRAPSVEITPDLINDIIDFFREGLTIGEICKKTGLNRRKIKQIHAEETLAGNHIPDLKKGFARRTKYSDEDMIELVILNQGYGFNRFCKFLGVSEKFLFDLLADFKEFFGDDLYQHLQDTTNHTLVSEADYKAITGNKYLPSGYGRGTGPRPKRENRTQKKIYLPPQEFIWGEISRNDEY